MRPCLSAFAVLLAGCGSAFAENRWTEFRGPSGTGHSDSTGLPREWAEGEERGLEDRGSTAAAGRRRWSSATRSGSPPPPRTARSSRSWPWAGTTAASSSTRRSSTWPSPQDTRQYNSYRLAHPGDRRGSGLRPLRQLRNRGPRHRDWQGPLDAPRPSLQPLARTGLVADPLQGPPDRSPRRLRPAVRRGPRQEDGADGLEGRPHPRLRHRRRRPEEGIRDPGRDRGRAARPSSSAPPPRPWCRSTR